MTDALQVLTENTAKFAGGSVIKAKYYEIIGNHNKQEQKSGDEIVVDIVTRAGLELA